ncbi:MAG: hypothetical protein QG641_1832 [Candidatus Poribacteria bacterium]|nr:hypothetical protein [Candidatus Poribacteria bacterium]
MIGDYQVNIAQYATMEQGTNDVILRWEEMRDIFAVVVVCDDPSMLLNAKLQYWQRTWPNQRVPKGAVVGAGGGGWMRDDDWFNGNWKSADTNVTLEGDKATYTFNPVNAQEFPDIKDFDAKYRRMLKLRIEFDDKKPEIKSIKVYTDSVWKETSLKIEWGENFADKNWFRDISVYNGRLLGATKVPGSIYPIIRYTYNEDVNSNDKTIVTIRNDSKSFSFLVDDVVYGEKIFVKDFDILITKSVDKVDYSTFKHEWETNHPKTVYDRIFDLPEQTYEKSWNDMPKKRSRGFMPLGCDGGRQKFGVDQNGEVFYPKNYVARVKGKDTERLLWEGNWMRYSFGFPNAGLKERHIEDGYLPIIYAEWESDGVSYEQTAFVTWLGQDILSDERMQGDDPTVLLMKVTLRNLNDTTQNVSLKLKAKCDVEETLEERDGFVYAVNYEPSRLRYFINTVDYGSLVSDNDGLSYNLTLMKNESHSFYVNIPFITLTNKEEFDTLKSTDYEYEFPRVKRFWEQRVAEGTQIDCPNATLTNFYKAQLTHMLITDDREPGSDRYISRVGTFPYGIFPNESMMCISDFDRRGYKKEVEERLEMLIYYQGTVGLPGMFSSIDGQYYGANGYECGGYNQHHGWTLWAIGEHYWYHHDKEWLNRIAPSVIKACQWVINERQSTMKADANGNKVLEYGFLPTGSLEDVTDFWHWLSTNAATYWGFKNSAKALADIGHPEGKRLLAEAEEFGNDLRRGFRESMVLAPVVKLRDGTYIPHFPPRLYQRGRGFGWIRETLEGAIHLIRSEILNPCSQEATWIMKDFEDNLYISERYGYTVEDFERDWFSLGGFSMQSNLLCSPLPYVLRDEPKHFLRSYFNSFTSVFYPDICACVEHALPDLAGNNGVWYKPSDEAQSTYWFRMMFVYECENELNLGMAIPREWLEDGKSVGIERAMTYFGEMGYKIVSESSKIKMSLYPPTRNVSENINVRFRHPQEKPIKKVLVNGKEWSDFDPSRELIKLGKVSEKIEIVAYY